MSDTTRAPTCGTRTSRRWPSRRWIASRSGRLMPGARQLRLGDLAAGAIAFDDGRLDAPEDVFREGLGLVLQDGGLGLIQHIVDTFKSNAAKLANQPEESKKNEHCRQSSNNELTAPPWV
jgi:hypothetical protein